MPSTNLRCQLPSEDDYLCNHPCTLDSTRLFVFSARLINSLPLFEAASIAALQAENCNIF
jgi:hypothetical protein